MLKFKVVGCASGMPHPRLACSSYLVEQRRRLLLFDAGEGLSSALRRLEIDPRRIGTVFVSHLHSDHWVGLLLFLQFNYLVKRKERLDVFLPAEGLATVRNLLGRIYLPPEKLPFELELHPITKSLVFEMTDLKVRPHLNRHLQAQAAIVKQLKAPNKMQCYSFVIEADGAKIVYSSDIGGLDDLRPVLPETDLLVLDGNHIDLTDLPEVVREQGISQIMLTHLPEGIDLSPLKRSFARIKGSKLLVAREGLEVAF